MIIYDHTLILCIIYVCKITASICRGHLCPAHTDRETGHSSCQPRFILSCVLNTSDDLIDQPFLVVLFGTDRSGGAPHFIHQKLFAHSVLSDPFPCIFWECGPLWIFKVTGDIWDVNYILICAAAPYTTSLEVSSSTSFTSSSTSSVTTSDIETSTSSSATVSTDSIINTTLSEVARWRVGRWIESCNHFRQVSGWFDKCGRVWLPTNVDFYLQLCVWWHNLV